VGHVVTVSVKTHHSNNVHEKDHGITRISVVRCVLILVSERERTGLFTLYNNVATRELEQAVIPVRAKSRVNRTRNIVGGTQAGRRYTVRGESARYDLRATENLPLRKAVRNGRVQQ
jgi:hypothetical protein